MSSYTGNIRFHTTKNKWQFSNDGDTFANIASEVHTHTSADITDASVESKGFTLVMRDEESNISADAFNIAQGSKLTPNCLNVAYNSNGELQDSYRALNKGIVLQGVNGHAKLLIDEGSANLNLLWNASRGMIGQALVSSRTGSGGAARLAFDADDFGADIGFYGAPTGPSGSAIDKWYPEITIKNNELTIYRNDPTYGISEPKVSIDKPGNVWVEGVITAPGFDTKSLREYKQDIVETVVNATEELNKLVICEYTYKDDPDHIPRIGIIADDTENTHISGINHDTFSVSNTLGYIIKAIQQVTNRLDCIEQKLRIIEGE